MIPTTLNSWDCHSMKSLTSRISISTITKPTLDDTDKKELEKAKTVLQRYPHLQLTISAHADDRGTNKYNLNLSKRRAKAVASYLAKIGVNKHGVSIEAHGESIPAIPCPSGVCDETQREKNRRAEFTLSSSGQVVATQQSGKSKTKTASRRKNNFFQPG